MYKIFLHPKAKSAFEKLETDLQERIKNKIAELKKSPEKGAKHLKYSNFWRIRVGDYRIIYEIDRSEQKVIVLFIGHRKKVYDDFSRLF
ncbi:MAG: type II toxin-antitoxin system RelE family toxin [Candidatus Odinarchaeia archaeon]